VLSSAAPTSRSREPAIFFFEGERDRRAERRHPLAGCWALLVGGGLLAVLTLALRPAVEFEDCPNYGGSGNASAFGDGIWDLVYLFLLFTWMAAVVTEQVLPITWRGRHAGLTIVRALLAVLAVVIVACGVEIKILALCH
jgi:hypothetical protein